MALCCPTTRSARALKSSVTRASLRALVLAVAIVSTASVATAHAAAPGVSFDGNFQNGVSAWMMTGGGPQCANYGTPSTAPRIRGNVVTGAGTNLDGIQAGRFDLPASQPSYPLQACEMTHARPIGLGTDDYYGYMFYVPQGWTDGTTTPSGFWGIATAQLHFQNIWGAPITFELHTGHMTLALETGACNNFQTANAGCAYRSNADNPSGKPGNLGAQYIVPPGSMTQGVWHEVIMHVHWAADNTGQIQVWHRLMGDPTWTQTVNLNSYPTVQYDSAVGCCGANVVDKVGAYRGLSSQPVSVYETGLLIGSSFNAIAAAIGQPSGVTPPAVTQPKPLTTKPTTHPRQQVSARAATARRKAARHKAARHKAARHRAACRLQRLEARRHARRHKARKHHRGHSHHARVLRCGGNFR